MIEFLVRAVDVSWDPDQHVEMIEFAVQELLQTMAFGLHQPTTLQACLSIAATISKIACMCTHKPQHRKVWAHQSQPLQPQQQQHVPSRSIIQKIECVMDHLRRAVKAVSCCAAMHNYEGGFKSPLPQSACTGWEHS